MLAAVGGSTRHLGDTATAFRDVLRNRNTRRLELAWAFANIGHWAYVVAVNVFAYNAGGVGAVGLLMIIRMVPAAIIAPFAATLADRYRGTRSCLVNLARAALIGAAGLGVLLDVPAVVVYALAAAAVFVRTQLNRPWQRSRLPPRAPRANSRRRTPSPARSKASASSSGRHSQASCSSSPARASYLPHHRLGLRLLRSPHHPTRPAQVEGACARRRTVQHLLPRRW